MSNPTSNNLNKNQPEQQNANQQKQEENEHKDPHHPLPPTLTKYLLQPHHQDSPSISNPNPTTQIPPKLLHRIKSHPTLTPLRRRTYLALLTVPRGHWTTYTALAKHLGSSSPRAVGTAMRTNPFAPDVPCHRVLAAGGYLGGYMGCSPPSSSVSSLMRKKTDGEREGGKSGGGIDKGGPGRAAGEHKLEWKRRMLEAEGVEFGVDSAGRVKAKGVCFGGFS